VLPNSIAAELDWQPGDRIISINGKLIDDIIDFQFHIADEYAEVLMETQDGVEFLYQIEKDYNEDLGVSFAEITTDGIRQCHNRCLFCFVDQMPPSLRSTLYVKDDDYRYSFLQGTFVTLTNLKEDDLRRIAELKLSPLYVSVHTTNPELRARLLRNKRAAKIMEQLRFLAEHGIEIHAQIVLCARVNDEEELRRSIEDLRQLWPAIRSLAVVPVGLTQYRTHLTKIESISVDRAQATIDLVTHYQQTFLQELGTRFVYLADEFYLMTGQAIPHRDAYEGFPQLENGIGIVRLFIDDFAENLTRIRQPVKLKERFLLLTGVAAAPILADILEQLNKLIDGNPIQMTVVENNFFGGLVTVAGLLSGSDIIKTVRNVADHRQYTGVLLPDILLNEDGVTIDDFSAPQLEQQLGIKTVFLPSYGSSLIDYLLSCS
jgi:putative radical SAM enzyme (TIGR03279 family)